MNSTESIHHSYIGKIKILEKICKLLIKYNSIFIKLINVDIVEIENKIINLKKKYDIAIIPFITSIYTGGQIENSNKYFSIIKVLGINKDIDRLMTEINTVTCFIKENINILYQTDTIKLVNYMNVYNNVCIDNNPLEFKGNYCVNCVTPMIENDKDGNLTCSKCGFSRLIRGYSVMKVTKTKNIHNTNKYCEEWLSMIEGKLTKKIPDELIMRIKERCTNTKTYNPTFDDIRMILKSLKQTRLNHYISYIHYQVTEVKPEQYSEEERNLIKSYFISAMDKFTLIKEENRTKKPNYAYFIFKLTESLLPESVHKRKLLNQIHLQKPDTLTRNDKYWVLICESWDDDLIKSRPTNPFYMDEYSGS